MKPITIILLIALLILLFILNIFISGKNNEPETSYSVTPFGQNVSTGNPNYDLFASGKSLKCNVSTRQDGELETSVTYYDAANKLFRSDSMSTNSYGERVESHLIIDNKNYQYAWNDTEASKGNIDQIAGNSQSAADGAYAEQYAGMVVIGEKMAEMNNIESTVDCQEWQVDPAMFMPSANVEFIDMGQYMQDVQNAAAQYN